MFLPPKRLVLAARRIPRQRSGFDGQPTHTPRRQNAFTSVRAGDGAARVTAQFAGARAARAGEAHAIKSRSNSRNGIAPAHTPKSRRVRARTFLDPECDSVTESDTFAE